MLAIRLQRRGRKGLASYRIIVQEKQLSPKSEKVAYHLGVYDPYAKKAEFDKEKAEFYLSNGAHPSNRVAKIFKAEGVKLPDWVVIDVSKQGKVKNPPEQTEDKPAETEAKEDTEEDASNKEDAKEEESSDEKSEAPVVEDKPEEKSEDESKDEAKESKASDDKEAKKDDQAEEKTEPKDKKAEENS